MKYSSWKQYLLSDRAINLTVLKTDSILYYIHKPEYILALTTEMFISDLFMEEYRLIFF